MKIENSQYQRLYERQNKKKHFSIFFTVMLFVVLFIGMFGGFYLLMKEDSCCIALIIFIMIGLPSIYMLIMMKYIEKFGIIVSKLIKITRQGKSGIIEIKNMPEQSIKKKIEEFTNMYKDKKIINDDIIPKIKKTGKSYFLIFDKLTDFHTFCFWINYLNFSDNDKCNNIVGRYPTKKIFADALLPKGCFVVDLINKNLMVFCLDGNNSDKNSIFCLTNSHLFFKKTLNIYEKNNTGWYECIPLNKTNDTIEYKEMPNIDM